MMKLSMGPSSTKTDHDMVQRAIERMLDNEREEYVAFQHKVSETYLQLLEELDQGLEELADQCPDEIDPRKWTEEDWVTFDTAVFGHKFERLYRTMAQQEPNLHIMWDEIKNRLDELSE